MPTRSISDSKPASIGRELWGTERFWHFAHTEHQGAFDMVSLFEVDRPSQNLDLQAWKAAWSSLSSSLPVLQQRVVDDNGQGRIWDHDTRGQEKVFSGPHLQNDQQRIEFCLQHRQFDTMSLTVFDPNDAQSNVTRLAVTNPHALGDAHGVFKIVKALIEAISSGQPLTPPPSPQSLNNPRTSEVSSADSEALGLRDMFEVAKRGSTTGFKIIPKEDAIDSKAGFSEWRRVCTLSSAKTHALVKFCKANSLTISALLKATILHAMLDILHADARNGGSHTFTVPAMPFLHPTKASGATSTVFAPITVHIGPDASVQETAAAIADSFALARRFDVEAQDDYVKTLLKLFTAVRPETSVPTLSSLGRLEGFAGLKSYQVAARNNLPSMGIHVWTLNGLLNLSLSWNPERFDRDQIEKFWSSWIDDIKRLPSSAPPLAAQ